MDEAQPITLFYSPDAIVTPPALLRTNADKVADYIVRNGKPFKDVIKCKERNDPCYLHADTKRRDCIDLKSHALA